MFEHISASRCSGTSEYPEYPKALQEEMELYLCTTLTLNSDLNFTQMNSRTSRTSLSLLLLYNEDQTRMCEVLPLPPRATVDSDRFVATRHRARFARLSLI